MRTIETVRAGLNQHLVMQAVLTSMIIAINCPRQFASDVRAHLVMLCITVILEWGAEAPLCLC